MKKKLKIFLAFLLISFAIPLISNAYTADYSINLNDLSTIKTYFTVEELKAVETLEDVYITKFLYDGVSSVKAYDLDDFIDSDSNEVEIKPVETTAINIHRVGEIEISGELTGGMIAINTNGLSGNLNIYLKDIKLDTDSKKVPAIYVYNKDINYSGCKVTIKAVQGTKNYIEGGKIKKTSLIPKDALTDYANYYSNDVLENYNKFSNYYGVYTGDEISNILFATVKAKQEDLIDGDSYTFYKGSGAISSDIDLFFEGEGELEVVSKGDEGIEGKGNIEFIGGKGDYKVYAKDDCINTTTSRDTSLISVYKNDIKINVNSMIAIVDDNEESEEGDAIDSNGKIIIDGGNILALAHPGQDSGLDSDGGVYINGGTVVATGDMYDEISNDSKQQFIVLNFAEEEPEDTIVVIHDSEGQNVIGYVSNRRFSSFVYSSPELKKETYKVYLNGKMEGKEENGIYTEITSYAGGALQQWTRLGGDKMTEPGMGQMRPPEAGMIRSEGKIEKPEEKREMPNESGSTDFTLTNTNHVFSGVSNESKLDNIVKKSTTGLTMTAKQVLIIVFILAIILLLILISFFKKRNKKTIKY